MVPNLSCPKQVQPIRQMVSELIGRPRNSARAGSVQGFRRDRGAGIALAHARGRSSAHLAVLLLPRRFEVVSVFLKSPEIRFQQPEYPLSIPCANARRPQANYQPLLPEHNASRFGDVLLNTVKLN